MTTQKYRDAAAVLLQQAETELATGDARQAAEKAWGAAAQKVKSVCEGRGWRHHSHFLLRQAVDRLTDETGDEDLALLFDTAQNLHKNFYEDFYNTTEVSRRLTRVHRFITKLDSVDYEDSAT